MKKFLLIPILLIVGAISASACSTCAAHTHGNDAATECPTECAKPCCDEAAKAAKCDQSMAECAKEECDKPAAECANQKAAAASANAGKKACCPASK